MSQLTGETERMVDEVDSIFQGCDSWWGWNIGRIEIVEG